MKSTGHAAWACTIPPEARQETRIYSQLHFAWWTPTERSISSCHSTIAGVGLQIGTTREFIILNNMVVELTAHERYGPQQHYRNWRTAGENTDLLDARATHRQRGTGCKLHILQSWPQHAWSWFNYAGWCSITHVITANSNWSAHQWISNVRSEILRSYAAREIIESTHARCRDMASRD